MISVVLYIIYIAITFDFFVCIDTLFYCDIFTETAETLMPQALDRLAGLVTSVDSHISKALAF